MNEYEQKLIDEYESYLSNSKYGYKNTENLKNYEKVAQQELKKLEKLDEKHKLYDKDYESFRLAMGRLASNLNKLEESNQDRIKSTKIFMNLNDEFEELMQRNIMKDAYVW